MIFNSSVKNVIISAYENETDVFLRTPLPSVGELFIDDVKSAVFMPGDFYSDGKADFYDIRQLGDEEFRKNLRDSNVRRIVVLFSECADKSEYGYREAFGWVGEMRAEAVCFIQVVAFFSPCSDSYEACRSLFLCKDVICLGEKEQPVFDVFRAVSSKAKFYQTAQLVEKYAFRRSAVYFNSREEARCFSAFLMKRGTRCAYVDGSVPFASQKGDILRFFTGEVNILVATKSYIPTSYFYPPEKVFFCGMPFSPSHLLRCANTLRGEQPFIVYCEDDIKRNEKIIASFSERLCDGEISEMRIGRLKEMCKMTD